VRQEGGFSPTTQSAMDWALEELLQGPEESMMIKHDDRATDYIDQLHEMLNKHHPTSEGSVVCDLLPPPSNEDAVTSRSTKGEDRVGGTGVTIGASRAPPDFSSFRGKTISFKRPPVPLSPPEFSDLPPVLEDDLLPVLSPPEGYRDGPLAPPPPLLPPQLALRLLPSLPPPLSPLSPEYHHRRSMTQQQRLDNNTCPEEASSSSTSPPQQLQDQHLLPAGQQDSGPQANFPYHYLQHQDEASTTCSSISSHDLEEETNNKKIFTKTREENNFRWGRGPKRRCSTSTTPILSSMLATEPSNFRQTGPVPPASYISIENDSGIESLDSLSPNDLDNTPLHSPEVVGPGAGSTFPPPLSALPPGREPSILTSLLSAPPSKEPSSISQSMLSTLLTCTTKSEKAVNEITKINVVTINPHNMTLVNQGETQEIKVESKMDVTVQITSDHELSLAEFLDGCAKVANETTSVVRSTLEDLVVTEEKNKTNIATNRSDLQNQNEVPEKHDEFDHVMCQTLGKVVPEWDTDLNFRLRQLDTVLASQHQSSILTSKPSANSTSCSDEDENSSLQVEIQKKSSKRYTCSSCDATFNSCGARNSHRRKVHERFHLCRDCDLAFGSAQKLERHMKTHLGVKEFKCETCGKEFMIERNLILHYKLHLGQKDFICSVCNRTYYTKSGLQAHVRQLHAPPPKSQGELFCKQCLQKCSTRYDLTLHRKKVHAGDVFAEKCSQCPMSFKTLTELKRHNIAEHSNRPYACPHCPHRSKTKDKLDRHLLCHSGPRESYQCQHCEKKFVFKNSLKKHLEKGRCDVLKQQKRIKLVKTEEDEGPYHKDITKINDSSNGVGLQNIDFDLLST